ncbi:hypothetical protein XENORESO_001822 [Xenotaenia resolanae]|uniref:Uncharacterized protein n=1 Tax=Xenotaenia resolanae TaxID=208358 RepID=A0ABV0WFM1_9TELE
MTASVLLHLFPYNHCTLVYSNELVAGLARCQRSSSAASKLYAQTLGLTQTHLLTHSHPKQKEWPRFTSCKPCLGGFIKSDLHYPAFPGCFPVYQLFLAFLRFTSLPIVTVKCLTAGSQSSQTLAPETYSTRGYYDHRMNEVLGIRL